MRHSHSFCPSKYTFHHFIMSSINVKPTLKLDTSQQMPPPSNPENPRPILKLNTASRQPSFSGDVGTPTPSAESRKIKIKISSQPTTPAATPLAQTPTITKSKAGRTSKPTQKLVESKKRPYDSDEDRPLSVTRHESRPSKTIKIKPTIFKPDRASNTASTPISTIKFKPRGEPVEHHPGDAYDSEASDREADPVRETTFILRVMPGAATEYLKKALAEGTIGVPKQNGGADFGVQFLDAKQRRAMVTIDGTHYAAVLVQLPTITEAMKSWDRKNMMKNSDIVEMLLCFATVNSETEAKTIALPSIATKNDYRWPHGLTPPMHDAYHRRFRKTVSEKQWQSTADQVAKLLEDDANALESHSELIWNEDDFSEDSDDEEDAEGEAEQDYFGDHAGVQDDMEEDAEDDEMLAAMEAELAESGMHHEEPAAATPAMQLEAQTPMTVEGNTPAAMPEILSEEDEDEDDDDDEDVEDGDDDEDDDVDEEQLVAERERKEKLDEIEHLKKSLDETIRQLSEVTAPILKKRVLLTKANLEKEIAVKKAALGLTDED
ncbi:TAFII55 protein conserved region-domain-containing protein [Daldinia vernicosa]|uniref:TAFII55 protein conserved region-domain-containing protein n=1 Tax=Daldinia vernicosa TaxID=114800 RepID=UPI0020076E76|nr:TAFII55 protein conserved region-domain-containing protein [Daldinia vernicosa]KAI0852542.1 TAFII55 protein conserved region-domain-containing protein [Daldinia vernicosa]